jgi:signal transduction histidine kinase
VTSRLRPTIRVRLTLLYGALFLVAGLVLLGVTYVLVKQSLYSGPRAAAVPAELVPTDGSEAGRAIPAQDAQLFVNQVEEKFRTETLDTMVTRGVLALGLVGVVAVGFGYVLAGRALRPLQRITETAQRVSHASLAFGGGPAERLDLAGPRDELKELADTFDQMLERLAQSFDGQRRFVVNASHELRTPLAINRTLIEVALRRRDAAEDTRRLGEALLVVNARHERLIEGLLTLARGENALVRRSPVNLRDVAGHVLTQARAEAAEADVTIQADLEAARTSGDPVLLERLAQNLIENAIRHNHAGGWIRVNTVTGTSGEAELVVTNTGPAVPPYEVDAMFEPFRRLRADRVSSDRGAGLGLSIVRAEPPPHRGHVRAQPRGGGGLTVTVQLPAHRAADRPAHPGPG